MKRTPFLAVALVIGVSAEVLAGGTLLDLSIPGPSLEGNAIGADSDRAASVYLPPSYDEGDRRYPTLVILHGIFDSNETWTNAWNDDHPGFDTIQALMDAGIEAGTVREMIVVIPDSDKVCHYTDSSVRGGWASFIANDLVSHIDRTYRTIPQAGARGIAGHSMGGHGAIKIAMRHPGTFSVVYALNPSLLGWGGDVSIENDAFRELREVEELGDLEAVNFYVRALVGVGQCFAPNPNAALLTDLPFRVTNDGLAVAQPGNEAWRSEMPVYLVERYADDLRSLRGLRFDSAFVDEFSHIPMTSRDFSSVLTQHGVEHTFEMYNGDHRNRLWGRHGRLFTELLPYVSANLE